MREPIAVPWPLASACWALLGLAGSVGCTGAAVFQCAESSQCSIDGRAGTCEPSGYCSFPDETCPSGQRYGDHAAAGLAETCVPTEEATGASTTTAGGTGTSGGSTGVASTGNPLGSDGASVATTAALDTSEGTTTGNAATTSATTSSSTGGSETGSPITVLSYQAALAECNDPITLDPDACELVSDPPMGAMTVDLADGGVGPMNAYLRFDLDDAFVPDLVVSVRLRLVATDLTSATTSGEVYSVEPFVLMDLFSLQPAAIGAALAPDQGPVAASDVVEWTLPPDLFALGELSVYLGVLPISSDGVDYWNLDGVEPPQLIVEQQG